MNTNSLKRFATVARNLLMQGVRNRLTALGFNDDGSTTAVVEAVQNAVIHNGKLINDSSFMARWDALRDRIASHGVKEVIEEAAYTWFNRLMAIRILEYNNLALALLDYENPGIRIPRIITNARAGKTPVLSDEDRASLGAVIGDGRLSFEQFAILIRAYCENNPIIRQCFGGITDYTMLLLPVDILSEGGFIDMLNRADEFIAPEDYRKPELIGWLYQFYISEKKDEVFSKKGSYDSNEIPAATQIFTPNWIVKYMVENTLGRIYLDNHPDDHYFSEKWKYLVAPAEPTPDDAILRYGSLEDLKCGDLSCGSGHILNEMFDLLMQLYKDDFYSPREAIEAIFTKNIVGIDLDIRACQLSQFALLLKACQTDSSFADAHCMPRIYSAPDLGSLDWEKIYKIIVVRFQLRTATQSIYDELESAFEVLSNAKVLGSIIKFNLSDATLDYLKNVLCELSKVDEKIPDVGKSIPGGVRDGKAFESIFYNLADKSEYIPFMQSFDVIAQAINFILALTNKYAVICMNPPYMPTSKEAKLKAYAAKEYPDSKADLFAIFMDVAHNRLCKHGKYGMINMQSWMFLSSFESLRQNIIENQQIDSLLHLGPRTFDELSGEVVQNAAFIISNENLSYQGIYYRLIDGSNCNAKREMFLAETNRYIVHNQKQFEQIPGAPIAYWLNASSFEIFSNNQSISDVANPCKGIDTGDNNYFLRFWHEISATDLDTSNRKGVWVPYNKGGGFRKWYGNRDVVLRWNGSDDELRSRLDWSSKKPTLRGKKNWFKECGTWSSISSGDFSLRYSPVGAMSDNGGSCIYATYDLFLIIGFLNSIVAKYFFEFLAPTINFQPGDVGNQPYIRPRNESEIVSIVNDAISVSKEDWDAHETSWDFETNELIKLDKEEAENIIRNRPVELAPEVAEEYRQTEKLRVRMELYMEKWWSKFQQLHANEEELNRKFIEIYGLQDELTPDVLFEDVTILQQGEIRIQKDCNPDLVGQLHRAYRDEVSFNWDVIIKQFISYAVGCMMGRYRLDRPGLAIAHPNPSAEEIASYTVPQTGMEWWIDDDGIVPMMGENCGFHDNAVNRFDKFIEVALGPDYKTDNLNFVREAIGKDIVDYLRNDFYADHKKMYQNRPIYWMFSSNQKGKRAAFQCLVYMHRMNRFTPEHIRTNYLLPYIETLTARESELSSRPSLSAKENKELKQLRADLDECRDYQLRLHAFADQQIEIDLDNGVVKNYATFAPVLAKLK